MSVSLALITWACVCQMVMFADAAAQDLDPLGRPRDKPPVPPAESSETGAQQGTELPTSGLKATPPTGGTASAGRLRDYVPEKLDLPRLPSTRDFSAEANGTLRLPSLVGPPGLSQDTQAENILTKVAEGASQLVDHGGYRLVKRSSKYWEFGLEITATGPMTGIAASAPVPIAFPEQKITVISEFRSPTVGNVRMKDHGDQGRQMIVTVPALAAGQTARATITMRLDRYDIIPAEPAISWEWAKKGSKAGRGFLGESPYIETGHRRIKELASQVVPGEETPWNQVQAIYDWIQANIDYEFDETIHSCLEALDNKKGDCEEFASLFIALCRARGIPARAVWCNDHTYPEFLLAMPSGAEVWLPCQLTTHEHIFGQMFDDRPILQKGDKFTILGETQPNRYLKPAMTVRSAAGAPQFKWIIQEVDPANVASDSSPLGR
jgi:hypothetical protein